MGDSEENNNENNIEEIEIGNELSTLITENGLPKEIADKIETKIKGKNLKITKGQLKILVDRIKNLMSNYTKIEQPPNKTSPQMPIKPDGNMQKLVETIEKLEDRIKNIETGQTPTVDPLAPKNETPGKPTTKIVTTDDIKIQEKIKVQTTPNWQFEPLTEIPNDPESIIVLMKWLQYLIDKCGRDNLSNILEYYVDICWITQDAKIGLIDYSHGIKEEIKQGEISTSKHITDLPSKDHIQSFIYIQKLKGNQFDRHFIDRIDGELSRITKKLENYNFK